MNATASVRLHPDRTLLLSWPPRDSSGFRTLRAYPGSRCIFIGEMEASVTGDVAMFDELDKGWKQVAYHVPVQWGAAHDVINVYDRKPPTTTA